MIFFQQNKATPRKRAERGRWPPMRRRCRWYWLLLFVGVAANVYGFVGFPNPTESDVPEASADTQANCGYFGQVPTELRTRDNDPTTAAALTTGGPGAHRTAVPVITTPPPPPPHAPRGGQVPTELRDP